MPADEQFEAMAGELAEALRGHAGVQLFLSPRTAIALIGNLQLALRHPQNKGPTSRMMRSIVDNLIAGLAEGNPRIESLLKRGDDPRYDL